MGKDKEYFAEDISYFYRNPLLLQMHHQEIRLRATVEAIRDSHIRQLEAMEQHRKFIEDFYSNGDFQRSLEVAS